MRMIIGKSEISGEGEVPPSKSITHRAIVLASLAEGTSEIGNQLACRDTSATVEACRRIGAKIDGERIEGTEGIECAGRIDVDNSGTTLRVMAPVCALADGKTVLNGDESIRKRPVGSLVCALKRLGVDAGCVEGMPPLMVGGGLNAGSSLREVWLDGTVRGRGTTRRPSQGKELQ